MVVDVVALHDARGIDATLPVGGEAEAEPGDAAQVAVGASPRAGLMLLMGAKSLARFAGRDFVIPDDIQAAFVPVMRHRVVLSPSAGLEGTTPDVVLGNLLESVEVPR